MEARNKTTSNKLEARSKHELIIEVWEGLGRPAVGAAEIEAIQAQLASHFGDRNVHSPAAIARVLADIGAPLRHPEIIECDAKWRAEQIRREAEQFGELSPREPLTLASAAELIGRLEQMRVQVDAAGGQQLRTFVIELRKTAELRAKRKTLDESQRAEQGEIAEWFGVWLRTPNLFKDWIELRRRSEDFHRKFG